MIKPIMTSTFFLKRPSTAANAGDLEIARDLEDTLEAHRATCAGMAANMIGQLKRIIAYDRGYYNPEIEMPEAAKKVAVRYIKRKLHKSRVSSKDVKVTKKIVGEENRYYITYFSHVYQLA